LHLLIFRAWLCFASFALLWMQSYLRAGSCAITTNSYGITPGVGFDDTEIKTYCDLAGKLAREAVNEVLSEATDDTSRIATTDRITTPSASYHVLGSLGPLLESYRADKLMEHEKGVATYSVMATSLAPHVDCFIAETMSCVKEVKQAMDAVSGLKLESNLVHPMLVSYTLSSEGTLRDGESAASAICKTIAHAGEKDVDLLGILFNCCEPEAISKAFDTIQESKEAMEALMSSANQQIALGAYANRLTPVAVDWEMASSDGAQPFRDDVTPEEYFDKYVRRWTQLPQLPSVKLIGGCCGITPEHIAYLKQHL
jgi:S-methylmethionine-dependent homocysteine/selenocysteine methylase